MRAGDWPVVHKSDDFREARELAQEQAKVARVDAQRGRRTRPAPPADSAA